MDTTTSIYPTAIHAQKLSQTSLRNARQHQLDWLRVFAFGLLLVFHTAMVFVADWDFHFKSIYQSHHLQYAMLVIEPWRMACLWFISGFALQSALRWRPLSKMMLKRSFQLLFPLLIGVLIIVPPQLYVEMISKGDINMSFVSFMGQFYRFDSDLFEQYQSGIWPHIDVNHLWYLRSLWQYSLVLLLISPILNRPWLYDNVINPIARNLFLVAIICYVPLIITQFFLDGDDKRYVSGFLFLLYGFIVAKHPDILSKLSQKLVTIVTITLINLVLMLLFYHLTYTYTSQTVDTHWLIGLRIHYSLAKLLGLGLMLAIATRFFSKHSTKISKLNHTVYPCYILHQTFIVVFAWLLSKYTLEGLSTFLLVMVLSCLACWLCVAIIQRSNVLRLCFGMPISDKLPLRVYRYFYPLGCIGCLVIGLEILL